MTQHCPACLCAISAQPAATTLNVPSEMKLDGSTIASQQRRETLIYNRRTGRPFKKLDPATCKHPERAVWRGRCILCDTDGLGQ